MFVLSACAAPTTSIDIESEQAPIKRKFFILCRMKQQTYISHELLRSNSVYPLKIMLFHQYLNLLPNAKREYQIWYHIRN